MHQIPKLKCFLSRLAVVFAQSIEARCYVKNGDVDGAVPTGDAPTTINYIWVINNFIAYQGSLQNSTQSIGGHSVHQWAYLWWSGINCGGPKKYVNNQNDLIMISKGNATWNTTENLNHQTVLNFETCFMCLELYLGNVNFQNTELIAGLSDQQRQLFCWTDAVFAGLGHRSTRLFRRLPRCTLH